MILDRVAKKLLSPAGLDIEDLQKALVDLYRADLDFGDIYLQSLMSEAWSIDEGVVKNGFYRNEQGFGIRAISGEKVSLAYSDEISANAIKQSIRSAKSITKLGQERNVCVFTPVNAHNLYSDINPRATVERSKNIQLLKDMDKYARDKCQYVKQFHASISCAYTKFIVAATDGTLAADIQPVVVLHCGVVVEKNGRKEMGGDGGGSRSGFDFFYETVGGTTRAFSYVDEAIRQALVNLDAIPAPAGLMPVVLASGKSGVLIHEAVGHGLEGDSCRKGGSMFGSMMGKKVASDICTVLDNGTLPNSTGSINVDDEGVLSRSNVLIQDGIISAFMYDKHNSRLVGKTSTGNGRRSSYKKMPITRMTNTYMQPGSCSASDIIGSVKKGLYAVDFGGGQVDVTNGQFVFGINEAYLIEDGRVTAPVKGATLIGNSLDIMNSVSMIGNDLRFDPGLGRCGKGGQWVRVGIGIPTLKIDNITVGGTN